MNKGKIKFILFLVIALFFEIVSIFIGYFFQALSCLSTYNQELSSTNIKALYLSYILKPFTTINTMITEPNPLYIMCAIGSIGLALYMVFGLSPKTYQVESQYVVQGSQRWATFSEVTRNNRLKAVKPQNIYAYILSTLEVNNEKKK